MNTRIKKCCLCHKPIIGYGHNALPIKKGQCCDECAVKVIKERIRIAQQQLEELTKGMK